MLTLCKHSIVLLQNKLQSFFYVVLNFVAASFRSHSRNTKSPIKEQYYIRRKLGRQGLEDRRFKVDMNLMGTSIWPKLFPARLWSRLYDNPKCTSILKCELIKCACFWLLIGIVCVYVGGYKRLNCWFNEYVWVSRFYRGIATGDLFLMMSKSLLYSL